MNCASKIATNRIATKNIIESVQRKDLQTARQILNETNWSLDKKKIVLDGLVEANLITLEECLLLSIDEINAEKIGTMDGGHTIDELTDIILATAQEPQETTMEGRIAGIIADKAFCSKMLQSWFDSAGIHLMSQEQLESRQK